MPNPGVRTAAAESTQQVYDRGTIILHWLTAVLVVSLFASAETWAFLPRGTALRGELQTLHISLGISLAATIITRLVWRLALGRRLPPATTGLQAIVAKTVHIALYVLLGLQVALGFLFRWVQNEPFAFFGLFTIPHVALAPGLRSTFGWLHNNVAWAIIIIAGIHALTALLHHYVLKDRVLARMLPAKG
ncbi:cytochrome b [Candidatus Phyllobacterium onerii]|uniref:cytochrome b n=1 Tax=Candidatus Phyllobacterium onerii TaxID=3020828 RepID=UPI00232AB6C8|nr:cytochrome b [Phyllobacterium sp. IY22]